MTRKWCINGRFLTQSLTGVQRYAREIVRALDEEVDRGTPLTRDLDLQLVLPRGVRNDLQLKAIRTKVTGQKTGHFWEQFVLPGYVEGGLLSLGNVGPISVRRQIVCMHDANTRVFPESYSRSYRASYRVLQPLLGRVVARVATVSHFSAEQLVRYGICGRRNIVVIPNGHEHALQWHPQHSTLTRAAAGQDTIVVIGTPAPHKNVRLITDMADRLAKAGLRVAIVGNTDPRVFQSEAQPTSASAISWLGRVSDQELAALLQDSLCLAFPSFVEGFGLPPLEAMTLGCAVVTSDRSSPPEICGDAALYASPVQAGGWLEAFATLRHDPAFRNSLIERGRARARRFSWKSSAEQYLSAMATVDGQPRRGAVRKG